MCHHYMDESPTCRFVVGTLCNPPLSLKSETRSLLEAVMRAASGCHASARGSAFVPPRFREAYVRKRTEFDQNS